MAENRSHSKPIIQARIIGVSLVLVLGVAACCSDSGLQTTDGRKNFIAGVNGDAKETKCTMETASSTFMEVTWTCKNKTTPQIATQVQAACDSYDALGIRTLEISGSDGEKKTCRVAAKCNCE